MGTGSVSVTIVGLIWSNFTQLPSNTSAVAGPGTITFVSKRRSLQDFTAPLESLAPWEAGGPHPAYPDLDPSAAWWLPPVPVRWGGGGARRLLGPVGSFPANSPSGRELLQSCTCTLAQHAAVLGDLDGDCLFGTSDFTLVGLSGLACSGCSAQGGNDARASRSRCSSF